MKLLLSLPMIISFALLLPGKLWACRGCEFDYSGGFICLEGCPTGGQFGCGEDCAISPSTGRCYEIGSCGVGMLSADGTLLASNVEDDFGLVPAERYSSASAPGEAVVRPGPVLSFVKSAEFVTTDKLGVVWRRRCDGYLVSRLISAAATRRAQQQAKVIVL